jgi:hypothetical protein
MSNKIIEHIVKIRNKNGEEEFSCSSSKEIPDFGEIGKSEFLASLNSLEDAVIETSKEVNTEAAEHILSEASKKKSVRPGKD